MFIKCDHYSVLLLFFHCYYSCIIWVSTTSFEIACSSLGLRSKEEEIQSMLRMFLLMASLVRNIEMQKGTYKRAWMTIISPYGIPNKLIDMMFSYVDKYTCVFLLVNDVGVRILFGRCKSPLPHCRSRAFKTRYYIIVHNSFIRATHDCLSLITTTNRQPKNAINIKMTPDESSSDSTFKQVHRTEPVLEPYSFESNRVPAFSTKNHKSDNGDDNGAKVRFGLPRDKVRDFVRSNTGIVSAHHSWRKIPEKEYV